MIDGCVGCFNGSRARCIDRNGFGGFSDCQRGVHFADLLHVEFDVIYNRRFEPILFHCDAIKPGLELRHNVTSVAFADSVARFVGGKIGNQDFSATEEANLNVHISALRKVLAEGSEGQQYIETLPRLGYRFIAPVVVLNEPEPSPQISLSSTNDVAGKSVSDVLIETALTSQPDSQLETGLEDRRETPSETSQAMGQEIKKMERRSQYRLAGLPLWLLAVVSIGLIAFLSFKLPGLPPTDSAGATPMNVVPLTTYPENESQAAFSPDGNQIAFVWTGEKEGNTDVYVRLVEGGNWVRVTTNPGDDVNPAWSPNGRTLAFYRSSTDGDGVYLVPALGGAERKLTDAWANRFGFGSHTWLHWSPEGKWLVLSDKTSATDPFSLFLVSSSTGERRRLTSPPTSIIGDCSPAF